MKILVLLCALIAGCTMHQNVPEARLKSECNDAGITYQLDFDYSVEKANADAGDIEQEVLHAFQFGVRQAVINDRYGINVVPALAGYHRIYALGFKHGQKVVTLGKVQYGEEGWKQRADAAIEEWDTETSRVR